LKIEIEKQAAKKFAGDINSMLAGYGASVKFMEVCGTHTWQSILPVLRVSSPASSNWFRAWVPCLCHRETIYDQAIFWGRNWGIAL